MSLCLCVSVWVCCVILTRYCICTRINLYIQTHMDNIHYWDSIPDNNKKCQKKVSPNGHIPLNSSRREQIVINRSRIGHSHITHSYLRTKDPIPCCDICKTPLTMAHIIICSAPKYSTARVFCSIAPRLSEKPSINKTLPKCLNFSNI